MELFDPPLPNPHTGNAYLDTSVLRIILLTGKHDLGKEVIEELKKVQGKLHTSDYVVYELKRSILAPIWELYRLVVYHQNVGAAFQHLSQSFQGRDLKVILDIVGEITSRAIQLQSQVPLFLAQLEDLAKEIESNLANYSSLRVQSKTGCKLHKPNFSFEIHYPAAIKCRTDCDVEKFWAQEKGTIQSLVDYHDTSSLTTNGKKVFKKLRPLYGDLLKTGAKGKNPTACKTLADTLILLHAPKGSWLVLSVDGSFVELSKNTGHKVHQLVGLSKYYGGSPASVAAKGIDPAVGPDPRDRH